MRGGWARKEEKDKLKRRETESEGGVLPIVPSESLLMQCCHGDTVTGYHFYSNMASSWSARSSNMLPMSSSMLTVVFCSATELNTNAHTHISMMSKCTFYLLTPVCIECVYVFVYVCSLLLLPQYFILHSLQCCCQRRACLLQLLMHQRVHSEICCRGSCCNHDPAPCCPAVH